MVPGRSHHMGTLDPVSKALGTGTTNIMPERERHDPGTTVNRERVPPGMLRSLLTSRNGHLDSLLVEACIAGKVGVTSSGIRVHFLTINVDCLGSAMVAVVMESMAETILARHNKRAVP